MQKTDKILKNGTIAVLYSVLVSVFVVALCEIRFKSFFTLDDSYNEYLGFMRQYGQSWLSGEIPFITKNIMIGGNAMVELQRAIFAPQNILASLIAAKSANPLAPGLFYAFINIFLSCLSGYSIGKSFGISRNLSLVLGFFIAINPIFLYQYAGPWWNAANGHTWSLVAIATFCLLRQSMTAWRVVANFLATLILLSSGWPHGIIGYFVIVGCISLVDLRYGEAFNLVVKRCLPLVLAGIAAIPVYSEFIVLSGLVNRPSGWNNAGNFMVPSVTQLLLTFSPTYFEFMNYFGGFKSFFVPVGFSTIFFLLALFFYRVSFLDKNIVLFAVILAATLCLSMLPSQTGMLRWPIRFVPYFSVFASVATFYVMSRGEKVNSLVRKNGFLSIVLVLFVVSAFRNIFERPKVVLLEAGTSLLLVGLWFFCVEKRKPVDIATSSWLKAATVPAFCLALMLACMPSLGKVYLPVHTLPSHMTLPENVNWDGNFASFTGWAPEEPVEPGELQSALFGYYDIRSINGSSPNGHKYLDQVLAYYSSHAVLQPEESMANLSQAVPGLENVCWFNLFGVSSLAIRADIQEDVGSGLEGCGYHPAQLSHDQSVLYYSSEQHYPTTLTYTTNPNVKVARETNDSVTLTVPEHTDPLKLVFSRVWWPGYVAHGLTCPVTIHGFGTMLLGADIPAGCSGELKVSYFPVTWVYTLYCPVLAVIGLGLLLLQIRRNQKLRRILEDL